METSGRDIANRNHCLVCGFDFGQNVESDDDCPCCGLHMGYFWDDEDPEFVKKARMRWINERRAQWESMQPADWSVEKAWEQIRANVPEKFQ